MNKKLFLSMCVAPVAAMAFQIGAWVGGPGQYPQPTQQNVQAFQDLQGTHLDLISYFALFDINDWNATEQYANVAKNNGSTRTWSTVRPTPIFATMRKGSRTTAKKSGSGRSTKRTATGTTGAWVRLAPEIPTRMSPRHSAIS